MSLIITLEEKRDHKRELKVKDVPVRTIDHETTI